MTITRLDPMISRGSHPLAPVQGPIIGPRAKFRSSKTPMLHPAPPTPKTLIWAPSFEPAPDKEVQNCMRI